MTIQDKIISFETAKLAAKVGFNLYVIGTHHYNYYDENGEPGEIGWGHLHSSNSPMSPQGLLQKWLREQGYSVYVIIVDYEEDKKWDWRVMTSNGTIHTPINETDNDYEIVLERGLAFTLQLMIYLKEYSHA